MSVCSHAENCAFYVLLVPFNTQVYWLVLTQTVGTTFDIRAGSHWTDANAQGSGNGESFKLEDIIF